MVDLPIGNVITGVVTVISVVLANRLSSSQTGKAKLWDLRRLTYGVIASELSSVKRICDTADSFIEEDAYRYYKSDYRSSHDNRTHQHMVIIRQRFSDDYMTISDEFIKLFESFIAELDAIPPEDIFPENHEMFCAAVRKHRPLILAQGRREIAAGRRPWNRVA